MASNNNNNESSLVDFSNLLPHEAQMDKIVQEWIVDDMPSSFDIGGLVVGNTPKTATLWMKQSGIFAGKPFVDAVFRNLQCTITWNTEATVVDEATKTESTVKIKEGVFLQASGTHKIALATIQGPVNRILQGERTALNTLARCSGVATAAHHVTQLVRQAHPHWQGCVAGTRKTTPGVFRIVEKYGLLVGGCATHRLDLSQMVMLKDNHIWACDGSITAAVQLARRATGFSSKIEVECQNLEEALEASQAGADVVMLDNYNADGSAGIVKLKDDASKIKEQFPHVMIEASGGITTETICDYVSPHIDVISQGSLTQGYRCIDYSLKILK